MPGARSSSTTGVDAPRDRLRKPHRIAVLAPTLAIDGPDAAHAREVALLVWVAAIEVCERHPGLAVYDAESTPLVARDGHLVPEHAGSAATLEDPFWATTRRDELVRIELALPRASYARLHTTGRDGKRESFEALGRNLGDQLHQVMCAWLAARGLAAPTRRLESVTADELLATARAVAPLLVEQARRPAPAGRAGRALAHRLPAALRVAALRTLELALGEELGDLILAIDADHPRALFARYLARRAEAPDYGLLRRVIGQAPGWARPYGELAVRAAGGPAEGGALAEPGEVPARAGEAPARAAGPQAPTALETVAGAGLAALCRPGQRAILATAAEHLCRDGRVEEALRLQRRVCGLHDHDPRAHLELLELHRVAARASGRVGGWLAQVDESARRHGSPLDPALPRYDDQIDVDRAAADALFAAGRLEEAIALRARGATPEPASPLAAWRGDPAVLARAYAREAHFRGDPGRVLEGLGRAEPSEPLEVAALLDALVAVGREAEAPLAWAQLGLGRGLTGPVARLAAARALLAAGEWRRGLEELWRVELAEPDHDAPAAIARVWGLAAGAPIELAEAALAERMAAGAATLARRMARDIADFLPQAARSSIVLRALGQGPGAKVIPGELDPHWISAIRIPAAARRDLDEMFAAARAAADPLRAGHALVAGWLDAVLAHAAADDPAAIAPCAAYVAAQGLGRYFAATTALPTPLAGALRLVAAEALGLVRLHAASLADRDAAAILAAVEPLLRRADRWVGTGWLAAIERSCQLDERAAGDVAGFARDCGTAAARLLGPEEAAVLASSVARLHRERPEGWEIAAGAQAARLALHTGFAGVDEWADATAAQLAARPQDLDDAIDALHTACYLAEGRSAVPCARAARVLLEAGRGSAAQGVLMAGLGAALPALRDELLADLAEPWQRRGPGVPLAFAPAAAGALEALQQGDPARAEALGRWAVALEPTSAEAHRNLGLALAQQGKAVDALVHLARATGEQAPQILAGVLYQTGRLPAALSAADYASRWYARAEQWLTYAGIALAATDPARTARAYGLAHQLDPAAFEATQLHAYAGALDALGDYAGCERVARELERTASGEPVWRASAHYHLARAALGRGRFEEAARHAERAVADNPLPESAARYAAALARARARQRPAAADAPAPPEPAAAAFALLERGDFAAAAGGARDPSWRVRRAAIAAARFREPWESALAVPPRACAAAAAVIASTGERIAPAGRALDDAAPPTAEVREALLCRALALELREQACYPRDPSPRLGERLSRASFHRELRVRGGVILADDPAPAAPFVDRVAVPRAALARAADYVGLLRDLAALAPREALAQFELDEAAYLELGTSWGEAIDADPALGALLAAGLAKR